MTDKELTLIKNPELQKLFREKMGNHDYTDIGYDEIGRDFCTYTPAGWVFISPYIELHDSSKILLIPDIVSRDSSRPERGLFNMSINGNQILTMGRKLFMDSYFCTVRIVDEKGEYKEMKSFTGDTITEACLKALLFQVEQEG